MLAAFFERIRKNPNPTRLILLGFLCIILLGGLLLSLPISSKSGESTDLLTCLFTATSATCVTGLARVDTFLHWSGFGQLIILLMLQLGGLGFVSVMSLFSFVLGQRIGLGQRMMMASALNLNQTAGVVRVVQGALVGTVAIEGLGALLLSIRFVPLFGWGQGLWFSLFHSVSAFCNGGFDLMGEYTGPFSSLAGFQSDPLVLGVIMTLIAVGGIGFFVWADVAEHRRWRSLALYSRLALGITALLILLGWVLTLCLEWNNPATLGPMSVGEKLLNGLFQSVTLRTAGFAAIDQGSLTDGSAILGMVWMLIGGSSGSTAGGIKTVTVGVLFLSIWSGLRGEEHVVFRGRTIPARRVMDAMILMLVVIFLFVTGSMALTVVDGMAIGPACYEVASALGTVGLSMGMTTGLSGVSCLLIMLFMFLGRVGILSVSIAFLTRDESKLRYPMADIMIG